MDAVEREERGADEKMPVDNKEPSLAKAMNDDFDAMSREVVKRDRALRAARYVYHSQMVHRVSTGVLAGAIDVEKARELYITLMSNYDAIVQAARNEEKSEEPNLAEMSKGADAIEPYLELCRSKGLDGKVVL